MRYKKCKICISLCFVQYLVYSGEGNVVKDELEELGETEPVLATDTEAGDGLAIQLALPETGSGELAWVTLCNNTGVKLPRLQVWQF